jgi:LmbE family N-acetylglucosaminyl deacetylase
VIARLLHLIHRIARRIAGQRAGRVLEDMARLPLTPADVLLSKGPILVMAPHPDDESLGCGGLLALAAQRGVVARVVIMTDGSGSHPGSTEFPPERLRGLREQEATQAVQALGLPADAVVFLRQPDGALPRTGPGADALVDEISAECVRIGAASLMSTWIFDGHGDHVTTAILAKRISRKSRTNLYYYPIWGLKLDPAARLGMYAKLRGWRIDIDQVLDRKRNAIACHRSQMSDLIKDSENIPLTADVYAPFSRPFETYVAG